VGERTVRRAGAGPRGLIASYASSLRAWLQQRAELDAARERIVSGEAQVEA
jgi:hypothetical protein